MNSVSYQCKQKYVRMGFSNILTQNASDLWYKKWVISIVFSSKNENTPCNWVDNHHFKKVMNMLFIPNYTQMSVMSVSTHLEKPWVRQPLTQMMTIGGLVQVTINIYKPYSPPMLFNSLLFATFAAASATFSNHSCIVPFGLWFYCLPRIFSLVLNIIREHFFFSLLRF